jgi:hypothetical protein
MGYKTTMERIGHIYGIYRTEMEFKIELVKLLEFGPYLKEHNGD